MVWLKRIFGWLFPGGPGGLTELENREYDEYLRERANLQAAGFTNEHKAARDLLVNVLKAHRDKAASQSDVAKIDALVNDLRYFESLFK